MAADPSPEFQDWELLVTSDSDYHLEETEADSEGVLRFDHFSLERNDRLANSVTEEGSVESDNPSWIDPGCETRSQTHPAAEFWSDSGSNRSVDLGVADDEKNDIDLLGIGEAVGKEGKFKSRDCTFGNVEGEIEMGFDETVKSFEEFGGNQSADKDLSKLWSDPGGDILVLSGAEKMNEDSADLAESENGGSSGEANLSAVTVGKRGGCDEEKRKAVWWKVPFELLKYCAIRISPVWTFSMAAAVMGFVILGLRLYKMKRKARSLQLKVTVDDKKVSQFASRAARLNEAFSVVRRVPMVRPLLPAASGLNSWPVMNLR